MTAGYGPLAEAMLHGRPLTEPVIDIHCHIGQYYVFYAPDQDARGMIDVMDAVGVKHAAVSAHISWAAEAALGNDLVAAACRSYPGRFIGYASANPNYPETVLDELKRCFDELGFRLIKLHPSVHQYRLIDKVYELVFEFAEKRGAPILTHTWDRDLHCSLEMAAEVSRRHPAVTFLWAHASSSFDRAYELAADLPNAYLELCYSVVLNGQLEYFLKSAPPEKVLFGSDFSFISLPQQLARVVFAKVPESVKRKILYENSARILEAAGVALL